MSRPTRISAVKLLDGFRVELGLTDGSTKVVDLEQYFHGPVFDEIRNDPAAFAAVTVDQRAGTIVWPNGADIDPDVLCLNLTPAWRQQTETTEASAPSIEALS